MKMRSPIVAMLWEIWRVTRVEAAWKVAIGIVGGLAVLALCATVAPADDAKKYEDIMDNGAAIAMILLVLPHLLSWLSLTRLNGGRPGFPLYLHYTRPVRTAVMVGLPMAYLTVMSSAVYLVSALLLRVTSGYAFPLMPVAAWIAALTLIGLAATWSTRNRTIQVCVMMYAITKAFALAMQRLTATEIPGGYDWPPRLWPTLFDFPLTDYAWIALIGLACFGVTVAGGTRQRRGDGWAKVPSAQRGGFWDRLVSLFRFPCPTSSAARAQVWLDLKSNGLPVLTIGVALAIVILLVSAISGPLDAAFSEEIRASLSCSNRDCFYVRGMPVLFAPLSLLIVLVLAGNAFGIRRRQGRTYMSAFEATQAYGTAQLAALKLLVKSVCNQGRRRSADRVRAALTGGRGGGRCRHLGRGVRRAWSALDPLFPSREHRCIVAAALRPRARAAGAGGTQRDRVAVRGRRDFCDGTLDLPGCGGVHDGLRLQERLRGAGADNSLHERRPRDLRGIRGGMADSAAQSRRAAGRDVCDERRLDTVASLAFAHDRRAGALVVRPRAAHVMGPQACKKRLALRD
jgi:hypothetical protein